MTDAPADTSFEVTVLVAVSAGLYLRLAWLGQQRGLTVEQLISEQIGSVR